MWRGPARQGAIVRLGDKVDLCWTRPRYWPPEREGHCEATARGKSVWKSNRRVCVIHFLSLVHSGVLLVPVASRAFRQSADLHTQASLCLLEEVWPTIFALIGLGRSRISTTQRSPALPSTVSRVQSAILTLSPPPPAGSPSSQLSTNPQSQARQSRSGNPHPHPYTCTDNHGSGNFAPTSRRNHTWITDCQGALAHCTMENDFTT